MYVRALNQRRPASTAPTGHVRIASCGHVALISEHVHNQRTKRMPDT